MECRDFDVLKNEIEILSNQSEAEKLVVRVKPIFEIRLLCKMHKNRYNDS